VAEGTSPRRRSRVPLLGGWVKRLRRRLGIYSFSGSEAYWQRRYRSGRSSGAGSYGHLAAFKAEFLNDFVSEQGIRSVIEFGCGDGNQLGLARYPRYLGFDVSGHALELCRERFRDDPNRRFAEMKDYAGERAELTLSLDVIYHLVEDAVFESYMRRLFDAAERFVIVFSSNTDENEPDRVAHVRHRRFTDWVERERPDWQLAAHQPGRYPLREHPQDGSFADFYVFASSR
jgi:SAM-dependent methyltransferase